MSSFASLQRIARFRSTEARQALGLAAHEPIDIIKILRENADISFVIRPFSTSLSGMFIRMSASQIIVINSSKSLGHQTFTVAHEYYHLIYDKGMSSRVCATGKFNDPSPSEVEADYFAANLLMPAEALDNRLTKRLSRRKELQLEDVIHLEQYFGVSHKAMLVRLVQLQYISKNQFEQMQQVSVIQAARVLGYDDAIYRPTNKEQIISPYAEMAKLATDRGFITSGKYEQLLLEAGLADILYSEDEVEVSDEDI